MTDAAALRLRLAALRSDALAQLVAALPIVDAGLLRLVADTTATLAALDAEAVATVALEPESRALVVDDNATITLALVRRAWGTEVAGNGEIGRGRTKGDDSCCNTTPIDRGTADYTRARLARDAVHLSPAAAIRLGNQLVAAGVRRL